MALASVWVERHDVRERTDQLPEAPGSTVPFASTSLRRPNGRSSGRNRHVPCGAKEPAIAPKNLTADTDSRRGRYSDNGRWWWDDARQQWFRTTAPTETIQIELEDRGHTSMARSTMTTLMLGGVQSYGFVARRRGETDAYMTSPTFPMLPLEIAPGTPIPEAGWSEEVHDALNTLKDALAARGWRYVDTGKDWWSAIYSRPSIDWDTPPAAYEKERAAV